MKVAIAKETAPNERRVALVPEVIGKLKSAGMDVLVEKGAGAGASIPDADYEAAGATVVGTGDLYRDADVVLRVQKPSADEVKRLRKGQTVIGLLQPLIDPHTEQQLAEAGVTAISLDALPRTLSRAQTMDALSSQANVGGYKAVLIAADAYGRYFPLLTTAAGTAKPANVLVLGIGVAGLQAIATARRLGALVKAYDVRSETKEQAESLGAQFLVLKSAVDASGAGGYARQLTPEEQAAQQQELNAFIGGMDVVITTAQVPGRRPPVLVTADAVKLMKSGSVIVDMAASALGGNVELSKPDQTMVTDNGVTIIAPTNLPGHDARRRERLLRAQHLRAAAAPGQGRCLEPGLRGRDHQGHGDHERRRGDPRGDGQAAGASARRARLSRRRCGVSQELLNAIALFVLAILVGFEVISKVPATLHTPLMSGANSIHGIVLVGAMLIAAAGGQPAQLPARVRGHGLRRGQRRRRLRGHRPDAPDVPQEARAAKPGAGQVRDRMSQSGSSTRSSSCLAGGGGAFVIGLHQMNSRATARGGNIVSAGGMAVAVVATLLWLLHRRPGGLNAIQHHHRAASPSVAASASTSPAP